METIKLGNLCLVQVKDIWTGLPEDFRERVRRNFLEGEGGEEQFNQLRFEEFLLSQCAYFDGNVTFLREQWSAMNMLVVVNGDLEIPGDFDLDCCRALVTGSLVCDRAHSLERFIDEGKNGKHTDWFGRVEARQYAVFMGEDHEILHSGWRGRIDTPRLFSWFCDWRDTTLGKDTALFLMCPDHAFSTPEQDEWYNWRDEFFVLKPECVGAAECYDYDDPKWNWSAIDALLDAGELLYIDGYNPACQPVLREARGWYREGKLAEAFAAAKRAIEISPAYCKAWDFAGDCLFRGKAFAQAIPYYERAAQLFPSKHAALENDGLDNLSYSLLHLDELDRAIETATLSIDCTKHLTDYTDNGIRSLPYRIRGEAFLWKGELEKARDDLLRSWELHPTSARGWLLAVAYHKLGDGENARKYAGYPLVAKKHTESLDDHTDMYCLLPRPVTVDWA